jgi:hypothetical protein
MLLFGYYKKNKMMIGRKKTELEEIFDNLKELVIYKDDKYNGAADSPLNIFTGKHKYGYRIDDKLKRIQTSSELRKNDIVDLVGYIALILRDKEWTNFDDLKD